MQDSQQTFQLAPLQLGDALDIIESYQFYSMIQENQDDPPPNNDLLYEGLQMIQGNVSKAYDKGKEIY